MKEDNMEKSEKNIERSELVNTHVFNVSRELMFKMWTDFDHLLKWWCPEGCTMNKSNLIQSSSDILHFIIKSSDDKEMSGKLVFKESMAPEKVAFIKSFTDQDGNTIPAPFCAEFPMEVMNVLTLVEEDGKTKVIVKGYPINATEEEIKFFESMHSNMQQSFIGTFENLEKYLVELL